MTTAESELTGDIAAAQGDLFTAVLGAIFIDSGGSDISAVRVVYSRCGSPAESLTPSWTPVGILKLNPDLDPVPNLARPPNLALTLTLTLTLIRRTSTPVCRAVMGLD